MSTALAIRADEPSVSIERAEEHPVSFEQLVTMGDALVGTGFLPKHIRSGAQAAAIVLAGRELGMPPMRALRSLMMVEGKVVEAADSQLARFKSSGGRATWLQLDERAASVTLRHPNGDEHTETFTIEDATRAKLMGKDNWQKYPKAMLRSRVITAGLKSLGWDGAAGAYDPDEVVEFPAPDPAERRPALVERPETSTPATITAAQRARIAGLLTLADIDDAEKAKIAAKANDTARPMTEAYADKAIAYLEKLVPKETHDAQHDGAAAAGSDGTMPKGGRVQDALEEKPNLAKLSRQITQLLGNEKFDDAYRAAVRTRVEAATTTIQLVEIVEHLKQDIELPF